MPHISVYVKNQHYKPSNYYRIIQYIEYFPTSNIKIHSLVPNFLFPTAMRRRYPSIIRKLILLTSMLMGGLHLFFSLIHDVLFPPQHIIIQKSLTKYNLPVLLSLLLKIVIKRSNFIWDFDDNILYGKEISKKEFQLYCQYSNTIIVPSLFLKNSLPISCFNKTILLPTTDSHFYLSKEKELDLLLDIRRNIAQTQIHIIWVATSGNLVHLHRIVPILDEVAKDVFQRLHKLLVLKVVCDKSSLIRTAYLKVENIPWSREAAFYEQKISHIGIMPLIDNEYTRGKAGFKLVQYLSTGLPVIASNVGFNKNHFSNNVGFFLNDASDLDLWKTSILSLVESEALRESYSHNAYQFWQKNFNPDVNIKTLKELLR